MNPWQPIASAPKDCVILTCVVDSDRDGIRYHDMLVAAMFRDYKLRPDHTGWYCASIKKCRTYPSHWMPLPPPPDDAE